QRGSDDIFLFGNFANGNLDTNRDGLLDAADDTVDISSGSMVIDLGLGSGSIAGIDSLTVIGITSLDVQDSGLIILTLGQCSRAAQASSTAGRLARVGPRAASSSAKSDAACAAVASPAMTRSAAAA